MQATLRRPGALPRPPRPSQPEVHSGPAWVKAPPPSYHDTPAVHLQELDAPGKAEPVRAIRCPRCKAMFDWTVRRPTEVECPSCGAKGRIA